MATLCFGLLTVSDRCYNQEAEDISSVHLAAVISKEFLGSKIINKVVPDEITDIKNQLITWCSSGCDIIFTIGGTGIAQRDVTPEATKKVIQKEVPGLAYAMISGSLAVTKMAMLSRPVCGIRHKTLIINLPGNPKGAVECFTFIKDTLSHACDLIKSETDAVAKFHEKPADNSPINTQKASTSTSNISTPTLGISSPSKVKTDSPASRPRTSAYPMVEVNEACDTIFKESHPTLDIEIVPYEKCFNRVLAEDIFADENIPPFPASMKDGYAVKSTDERKIRIIQQVVAAGDMPFQKELMPGHAIRISTGAPVPPGADAVVQVEDVYIVEKSPDGKQEVSIELKEKTIIAGQDIRSVGSDIAVGSLILPKYELLEGSHLGILASLGKTDVKVFKKPTIAIISTGNEVKDAREKLQPGQIRDSNKIVLITFLKKYGFDSDDCGIMKDDPNAVKSVLEKALANHDVIITTGGVSMGEFDLLKQVLIEDFLAVIHFGRVNMKPGKPTVFATFKYKGNVKYLFGLPGNPVSCSVTSILFVIPTLRYLERNKDYKFPVIDVQVKEGLVNKDLRPEYHRIKVSSHKYLYGGCSTGNQISSRLNSMVNANGLALVPGYKPPMVGLVSSNDYLKVNKDFGPLNGTTGSSIFSTSTCSAGSSMFGMPACTTRTYPFGSTGSSGQSRSSSGPLDSHKTVASVPSTTENQSVYTYKTILFDMPK